MRIPSMLLSAGCIIASCLSLVTASASETQQVEQRLAESVKYLASDELEGRGIGTAGLDKAATFIADQFATIGLNTKIFPAGPFQTFTVTTDPTLGSKKENHFLGSFPEIKK